MRERERKTLYVKAQEGGRTREREKERGTVRETVCVRD